MAYKYFLTNLIISLLIIPDFSLLSQDAQINNYDQAGNKTGIWESYYPNGKVKSHATFKEGHPVGEVLKYYPDGILQAKMNFDESGRVSYVKMFYGSGNLAAEGKYIDQQKDSVWNYFSGYDKRKVVSETYLLGKKNGGNYKYYPNGKVSEFLEWQNDQKHGKWEQFFENGQLRLTGAYESDVLKGNFVGYNFDGSLSITGSYSNGRQDGIWTYYNETGELDIIVEYKDGKMLPNPEMEKRNEEFLKKINDAVGKFDDMEINEFK